MIINAVQFRNGPDQILPSSCFKTSEADGAVTINMSTEGPCSLKPISVHTFLKNTVNKYGTLPALAVKRDGKWKYWTYNEYYEDSYIVAKAFIKLGLERFRGVCIMGFNSPEWAFANFGCVFAGGIVAGVYTTNSPEACRHLADNCQAQIICVEDEECLDKFLSVKRFLPHIKAIIQWSGVPKVPGVLSWAEVMAVGRMESELALEERLRLSAINQCCTLIYTSGTTGPPKGVMCSQDHLTWTAKTYTDICKLKIGIGAGISYLPLSHLAGLMCDIYITIQAAGTIYFAQPDALKGSLGESLKEVQPTAFNGVPRVWEKMYEKIQEVSATVGPIKKSMGGWARYQALNYYLALRDGRSLSSMEKMKYSMAKTLVLNKIKEALGLSRATVISSGSAPIAKEILEFFFSLDLPLSEAYGLSESGGMGSLSLAHEGVFRVGSVGKPLSMMEMRIEELPGYHPGEGEIWIKGRNICMGYLQMADKTDETIDNDGWLHSGDIGRFDADGFLYITGRLKEIVITAGGENIPPVLIEDAIRREIPFVSNCMLVGDNQKYLTMLLTLKSESDPKTGSPLPELMPSCIATLKNFGSHATTVAEAVAEVKMAPSGPLVKAIQQGIERYNRYHAISSAQKIQRWTLLPHDFSQHTEELNNTLKLKRSFVLEKYKYLIDEMYSKKSMQLVPMSKL